MYTIYTHHAIEEVACGVVVVLCGVPYAIPLMVQQ